MKSSELLKSFFKSSYSDFKEHKSLFNKAFLFLILLNVLDGFPWELMGGGPNSAPEILMNLFIGIFGVIITVDVINSQVAIARSKPKEKLLYTVPSFLIVQILYILVSLIGLALIIVPGIVAFVVFGLAPLITIVEPNSSSFKRSYHLTKKEILPVVVLVFGSVLLELVPVGVAAIPGWQLRSVLLLILSYPTALISFLVVQSTVKLYFYLAGKE